MIPERRSHIEDTVGLQSKSDRVVPPARSFGLHPIDGKVNWKLPKALVVW